jgi:hypothetical protein
MKIDVKRFLDGLGGIRGATSLSAEARADALEHYLSAELDRAIPPVPDRAANYPTVADVESEIETRNYRRGVGKLFAGTEPVKRLPPLPASPTLLDFFSLRFQPAHHLLQSAALALKKGLSEEIILACLLHDTGQSIIRTEHGWWGAQLYEPYVPARTVFAIRYHQALRFYPDSDADYSYPEIYYRIFGVDYTPPPHVERAYRWVRKHKWYMDARMVTVNDLYAFDPNVTVSIEPFVDIIGRHFKQPREGLGNDNSPVAHMWRTIATPDAPL